MTKVIITSKKMHYIYSVKISLLMMIKQVITVYFERN
jgi:hypothetical protein